jgi:AcrR family transcriptional regulator
VRRKILDACLAEFGTSGFNGATMRDIAHRAGISQPGLIHHFPTKQELLLAVLAARDEVATKIALPEGDFDGLRTQVDVVRYNEEHRGLVQLSTLISAEGTAEDHPAHDLTRERYDNLRTYNVTLFTELRDRGALRLDLAPEVLANLFLAVIEGLQVQWLYNPGAVEPAASVEAFLDLVIDD